MELATGHAAHDASTLPSDSSSEGRSTVGGAVLEPSSLSQEQLELQRSRHERRVGVSRKPTRSRNANSSNATAHSNADQQMSSSSSLLPYTNGNVKNQPGVSLCSIRDAEQGIYEYLAEKHEPPSSATAPGIDGKERALALGGRRVERDALAPFSIPLRISGWLWRKGGLFRKFKRRFCVFTCDTATLCIYSNDDMVNGKLLSRFVVTQVKVVDRTSRELHIQGFVHENEIHKKQSEAMARRRSSLSMAMPGDKQRFYLPEEETLRAVSEKSLKVWAHCFRNHMRSSKRRRRLQQRTASASDLLETVGDEESDGDGTDDDINPDFQFEEPERTGRRQNGGAFGQQHAPGHTYCGEEVSDEVKEREDDEGEDSRDQLRFDQEEPLRITVSYHALPSTTFFEDGDITGAHGDGADAGIYELNGKVPVYHMEHLGSRNAWEPVPSMKSSAPSSSSSSSSSTTSSVSKLTSFDALTVSAHRQLSSSTSIWEDEDLLSYRVDFNAIEKREQLSVGAFGEVWLANYRSVQLVVIKHLKDGNTRHTRKDIQLFLQEIKILSKLKHEKIVSFLGVAWTMERDVQLMMEYVPGGDLRSYLDHVKDSHDEDGTMTTKFTNPWTWTKHQWRIAIDVVEGLVYLHSLNPVLLHCDIKAQNVLLGDNLRAKICDFGISRYAENATLDSDTNQRDRSDVCGSETARWRSGVGTGRWMAPEVLSCESEYSMASDVYAFGVLLSEIDTCELPFRDRIVNADGYGETMMMISSEDVLVHQIMQQGWRPAFSMHCPEAVQELARQCLAGDPQDRPSSLEVAYRLRKAASQCANVNDLLSVECVDVRG